MQTAKISDRFLAIDVLADKQHRRAPRILLSGCASHETGLSLIEGSLAMGGLFTAFPASYWTMKAFEQKEAASPATVEYPRYKKAA